MKKLLLVLLALVLAGCKVDLSLGEDSVYAASPNMFCMTNVNKDTYICSDKPRSSNGLSIEQNLTNAHNKLYKNWKYMSDMDKYGRLDLYTIPAIVDGVNTGDCEDGALFVMNEMLKNDPDGLLEGKLFIARVNTSNSKNEHIDHAILAVMVGENEWLFSDNRYKKELLSSFAISTYEVYDAVSVDNLRGIGSPKLIKVGE